MLGSRISVPQRRWLLRVGAVLTGFVVTALILGHSLNLTGKMTTHQPRRVTSAQLHSGDSGDINLEAPLAPEGVAISIQYARGSLAGSMPLPNTPLANPGLVGKVWELSAQQQGDSPDVTVAVTFPSSSLVVEYETPVGYSDPLSFYKQSVDAYSAQTDEYVGSVDGSPALIVPTGEDTQSGSGNPGWVEFVDGTTKVTVIGFQSTSDLESTAASIALSKS